MTRPLLLVAVFAGIACCAAAGLASGGPLFVGEELTYLVKYAFVNAGTAVLKVHEISTIDGRDTYHLKGTANTNDFFSSFYRVQDEFRSFALCDSFYPLRFERHIREGKYAKDATVFFNQEKRTCVVETNGERGPDIEILENTLDPLSVVYYLRNARMNVGDVFTLNGTDGRKLYEIKVNVVSREVVRTGLGRFMAICIKPDLKYVKFSGIMKKQGDIKIWLSDGEQHIPLLATGKLLIGTMSAVLIDAKLNTEIPGRVTEPARAKDARRPLLRR